MIQHVFKLIGLSVMAFCMISLSACKEKDYRIGQQIVIETSQVLTPKWVKQPPKKGLRYYYFVGQDTSFQLTDRYAYQNALAQVSQFLSNRATTLYQRMENTEAEMHGKVLRQDYIQNISQATITGVLKKEVYWEKVDRITADGIKSFYRYYILVAIHKDALKESELRTIQDQLAQQNDLLLTQELQSIKQTLENQDF